jgi:hypothetical protein
MRTIALAAVLLLPHPSAAAPRGSHRAMALEAGLSAPLRGGGPATPALALTASFWLEGPVEAIATVCAADVGSPGGRPAGEAGLRATVGDRLGLFGEAVAGWAEDGQGSAAATAGGGLGLAWQAGPVTLGGRLGLRAGRGGPRLVLLLGVEGYFF